MQIYRTQIRRIIVETLDIRTFLLDVPAGFTWPEGARTHFALAGFDAGGQRSRALVRHMSIATMPQEGVIDITTRLPQPCSEFKRVLGQQTVGAEVALFKTSTHLPLERSGRTIYLLSQGVGLATLRPLAVEYLRDTSGIAGLHSVNVSRPGEALYGDVFAARPEQNFSARRVHDRASFQAQAQEWAQDDNGLFYVVGSDVFLLQTVKLLLAQGVRAGQIRLDKHAHQLPEFLGEQAAATA